MAHDFLTEMVDDETGKAGVQIVATLTGGVLLLAGTLARVIWDQEYYSSVLGLVAALLLGTPLVVVALRDLVKGRHDMNELAALAFLAALASALYLTAGLVAFFMILSTLVESRTALGARKAIEALIRLTPTRASRVKGDGGEEEIDAKELRPGDVVRVRPGDNIPGDGAIVVGSSTVNQANITGESLPVDKNVGDEVFGGTINMTGVMDIRISKAGQDTTLGRVKDLVMQAQRSRTTGMRLADQYAAWYTPIILMIAAIVLFYTRDTANPMERFISVLVVACPSAIILSTPAAMVAALAAAARLGVLVKSVADFERARNLTAVVFDKTGTLTTGQLVVTRLGPAPGADAAALLSAAASLEQGSKHPVARAVMEISRRARVTPVVPDKFEEVAGRGVRGRLDGVDTLVGRESWIASTGVDVELPEASRPPEGLSLLYVAQGGKLLGWIGLEDKTRGDAAKAMDELREMGMRRLVMVTGDRWSVARRVAAELHCTDVQAEVLPGQKLELVEGLKTKGLVVAVVGDGVNDAPALAAGDLSIAMGAAGSDVAISSASIALMNNNLNRVPFLISLSRKALHVIAQNTITALLFILVGGSLSIGGYISPVTAAALHLVSSFLVVLNSARLVREGETLATIPLKPEEQRSFLQPQRVGPTAGEGKPAVA